MIPFLKKIFTSKKSDIQSEKIQHLEMRKKELEASLKNLEDIEKELKLIKTNHKL